MREELKQLFNQYPCEKFSFIHGDSTFSNTMLNNNLEPVFIDPRGYFGFVELFGDPNYDWAKLYYSVIGNYDQFNIKRFKLAFVGENIVNLEIQSNGWECAGKVVEDAMGIEGNWLKLLHGLIWLSLTTYAWEDYDSICGAFYNGLYHLEDALR